MRTWQLQDAKARLSEVIATAKKDGPQVITQRGLKTAVLLPFEEWERTPRSTKPSLLTILQSGPRGDLPVPARSSWKMRNPAEFRFTSCGQGPIG
jgi:prevent-host-death family protein